MSRETSEWLNQNTLIGFTDKRGHAWHYRATDQGEESNHYAGPVPIADVKRRLFGWHVESREIYTRSAHSFDLVEGQRAIVRNDTGTCFKVFTDGYVIHQYDQWLLGAVSNITSGPLSIGSAGLLKGGAIAWVSVELPDTITTPEGVEYRPNLLAATSHDGTMATTYKRVITNVVCDNTMAAGLAEEGQMYKVRHSSGSRDGVNVADSRTALEMIVESGELFAADVAELAKIKVSARAWQKLLDDIAPLAPQGANARAVTMADNRRQTLELSLIHI